jgi:excisionase family DNA binding protein
MVIMSKKQYSTTEAAEILGISRTAVLKRITTGSLNAQKVGRNYVINHEDLLATTGGEVSDTQKNDIENAVRKAVQEYGDVFEKLAKE